MFNYFLVMLQKGFLVLKKYAGEIMDILYMMSMNSSPLPCFKKFDPAAIYESFGVSKSDEDITKFVHDITYESYEASSTSLYDSYQYYSNNIQP